MASEEFKAFVADPRYRHLDAWVADIQEYCWHEEYEETD